VAAGVHAFVEHTDDFDQFRRDLTVVDNVQRSPYLRFSVVGARVLEMKATEPGRKFSARSGCRTFWIGGHFPHGRREHRRITPPAFDPPPFCTDGKDTRKVRCANRESRERAIGSGLAFARPCG